MEGHMHKKDLFMMLAVGYMRGPVSDGAIRAIRQDIVLKEEMNSMGLTLIELIVVITIIGSLGRAPWFFICRLDGQVQSRKGDQ